LAKLKSCSAWRSAGGVTEQDFELAARANALASGFRR
jgi:pterin-4a-carbinolamine dehydratase